jgi:hypothetical protein
VNAAPAVTETPWHLPTDEEEVAELVAVGILNRETPELGIPTEPAQLDAAISAVLRQIARAQLDLERYQAARAREHMTIDARYDRIADPLAERVAWLESIGRQLANEAHFPGKAKSRKVAFGSYGKRKVGGKLSIIDADALLAWARIVAESTFHGASTLIETKTTERVPHAAAVAYLEETGTLPDGCAWTDEYDDPFVKPDLSVVRDSQ